MRPIEPGQADGRAAGAARGQAGLSLVELLVSMTILVMATIIALTLYEGARNAFHVGENVSEQQQAVRIAYDLVTGDIRHAGFNANPDGNEARPDEPIEAAFERAIVVRADFDNEDPVESHTPEDTLGGPGSAFLVFGIPQARSDVAQERWEENDELMQGVVQALLEFREDCGRFPSDEEGLEALLYDYGYYGWRGPYLEDPQFNEWDEIVDIYGTALEYRYKGLQSPVLVTAGGDGEFEGDIGRLILDEGERGDDVVFWVR